MPTDPDALVSAAISQWNSNGTSPTATGFAPKTLFLEGLMDPLAAAIDAAISGTVAFNDSEGDPAPLGSAADGTSVYAARRDHAHAHGNLAGGSLHSLAGGGAAGFMSDAQVTKLAGIATGATVGVTTLATPAGSQILGGAISGVTLTLSLADGTNPGLVGIGNQVLGTGIKTVDALVATSSASGAGLVDVWNTHASGYSVLGYKNSAGTTKMVAGFGNASVAKTALQGVGYLEGIDVDLVFARTVAGTTSEAARMMNATGIWNFGAFPGYTTSATNVTQNAMARVNVLNTDGVNFLSILVDAYSGAATNPVGNTITFRGARGTQASPTAVAADDYMGDMSGRAWHSGGAFSTTKVGVFMRAAEAFTATNQGTYVTINTTPVGSTTSAERFRAHGTGATVTGSLTVDTTSLFIDATNHRVGLGTLTPQVPFHIKFNTSGVMGRVQCDDTAGFPGFAFYDATGTALAGIGTGNSATSSPYTNNMYIQAVNGAAMVFLTGAAGTGTERMRLTNAGALVALSTVSATAYTASSTGNASLTLDSGTGAAGGSQTSFFDYKLNGVLKGNIACSEADTGTPLGINSAVSMNVSLCAGGGNVVLGTLTDNGSGARFQTTTMMMTPQAAPSSGQVGMMYMATGGVLKICTVAGTPGTWVSVGTQT